jgi:DNA-binding NarL/FixJ family response regulator
MNKILIIEDQPQMRRKLAMILERENFQVSAAPNGLIGLDMARSDPPDLVICDVMMPELDGYGVLARLREEESTQRIPFIFLTAKGENQDIRTGMNLGADDYLTKPVPSDELLEAIEARLERAQQQQGFSPDFRSAVPLERLGLSVREAEILLWVAQGKSNFEIGMILGISAATVKKHLVHTYQKLSVETRNAATLSALRVLSSDSR